MVGVGVGMGVGVGGDSCYVDLTGRGRSQTSLFEPRFLSQGCIFWQMYFREMYLAKGVVGL